MMPNEPFVLLPAHGDEPAVVMRHPDEDTKPAGKEVWRDGAVFILGITQVLTILVLSLVLVQAKAQRNRVQEVAETSTRALCQLRIGHERQRTASRKFLKEHPQGIPGIPPALIRQGIAEQTRTIRALSNLKC